MLTQAQLHTDQLTQLLARSASHPAHLEHTENGSITIRSCTLTQVDALSIFSKHSVQFPYLGSELDRKMVLDGKEVVLMSNNPFPRQ